MAKVRHTPGPSTARLAVAIKNMRAGEVRVGWFESARYEDGTPVAMVAIVQELGSPKKGIPPRSFMRTTIEAKRAEWTRDSHVLSKAVIDGKMEAADMLEALGMKAAGDIRRTISKVLSPPLKESTIKARARRHSKGKASTKPLVDTGLMMNTLTSQVKKK